MGADRRSPRGVRVSGLRAGADTRVITPPLDDPARPVFLAGFQGNRRATGLHADLRVRTLALVQEGGRPFALAACDLIGVLREDTLAIRRAVADLGADVVVAATHTHSGPDTIGLWGPEEGVRGVGEAYLAGVRETVAESIRAAVAASEPAVLRAGVTEVDGVIRNYRDPDVCDRQVGVLAFDRPGGGDAIATVVNVGVHPEVLDGDSTVVSADLAGATCEGIERRRGGVALWASGDLGGMQSPEEGPRTSDEVARKAGLVVDAAMRCLDGASPVPAEAARVRYRSAEVELPLWNPMYRAGLQSGLLRGDLRDDGTMVTDVGVLDLGVARAAFWPGEVLPKLGMASKAALGTAFRLLVGLANDELGYILAQEDFVEPTDWDDPGEHYEESMSVGPETGPRLQAALDRLTAEMEAG